MLKAIKFLDVEDLHGNVSSFQIHPFDFIATDNYYVRVVNLTGSQDLGYYFALLKSMLPDNSDDVYYQSDYSERLDQSGKSDPKVYVNMFKMHCDHRRVDCTSRIEMTYYTDIDTYDELRVYEIAYGRKGIIYEKIDKQKPYQSTIRFNDDLQCYSFRYNNDPHVEYLRNKVFMLDLGSKEQVDYAIYRTAQIFSPTSSGVYINSEFKDFTLNLFDECGYDIRDIHQNNLLYNDYHQADVNIEEDDIRYLFALSTMIYATFVSGGIIIIDNMDLLDSSSMLSIINMYEKGYSDYAPAQLFFTTMNPDVYASPYKQSKTRWQQHL